MTKQQSIVPDLHGRLLVVDDHRELSAALASCLVSAGHEIHVAESATAALNILGGTPIDIVISDEHMSGMHGSQLLAIIRQQYPNIVRILISGRVEVADLIRAINEGEVYRFFAKPFSIHELLAGIQQALREKRVNQQSAVLVQQYQRRHSEVTPVAPVSSDHGTVNQGLEDLNAPDLGAVTSEVEQAAWDQARWASIKTLDESK